MARAGCNRKTALATLTMVLAAEAADIDVLWALKSSTAGLQHHRGIAHSFFAVPFLAAAVLGLVYLFQRWRRKPARAGIPVRWGYLYLFAILAALSHLLLDYTTSYGIRLFAPFNWRWYSWDIVYIVEPLMLLALTLGLVVPWFLGLISQEVGARAKGPRGRAGAIAALIFVVLLWGFRDYQHRRALLAMNSFLYRGELPQRLAAYPYPIHPFHWLGVVETRDFFETVDVNSSKPSVDDEHGRLYYKPPETPVLQAAKQSYLGQVYLDWAVFPWTQTVQLGRQGYLVEFEDLTYAYPDDGHRSPLEGYVLLSPELHVLQQGMSGRQGPPGMEEGTGPEQ